MQGKKKFLLLFLSVIFLAIYLDGNRIFNLFEHGIMQVELMPEKQILYAAGGNVVTGSESGIEYDGYSVAYDSITNTIYIPQNIEDSNWRGKLTADAGELYFAEDEYWKDKKTAIAEGHLFKLYQVTEENCAFYNVVFTGMPILCLSEEDRYWEEEKEIRQGFMQIYNPYSENIFYQSAECTYNIRGGSSWNYPKSNYKLELQNKKLSLLGMREDDDWILNSLYDDAGLIHNKLSTEVWHEIAERNHVKNDEGMNMEYVEVLIDHEYQGVYTLTERIDDKELSLGKRDILYKCRAERVPEEHNYTNENTDDLRPIFLLKYPKNYSNNDWTPIKTWVNFFLKEQFDNYDEGAELLNMENAIDYNLFCMLISGSDNLRKNIFFIAEYQEDGNYSFKKVPWDLNATWGNPWVDIEECNFTLYDPAYIENVDTWCTDISTLYFYDEEQVSKLLLERWRELRKEIVTKENINSIINRQFEYLNATGAYKRNYEKWTHGIEYWQEEYIYEYVDKRIDFLDGYYTQLYEECLKEKIYDGIDYSAEFDARYYWEKNKETLSELYSYDPQILLEHYALYGKPFGLKARR